MVMVKSANIFRAYIVLTALMMSYYNLFAQSSPEEVVHLFRVDANLQTPLRLALDTTDNIYITDANSKEVKKFNSTGTLLSSQITGGSPISLAVNSDNQVYIGEEEGNILKMNANSMTLWFNSDTIYPADMAFGPENELYVVDSRNKRVLVLDVTGNLIRSFGSGTLVYPSSIAYDPKNERIFVGEHGGLAGSFTALCKVWVFDNAGNLSSSFGKGGSGAGRFYRIQGITVGKCDNIYVSDPYQGSISVFDENLSYVTKFGVHGDSIGQLNLPMDVIFDSQERIIVSSLNNGALELYNISDTLPTSKIVYSNDTICIGDSTDITIEFTGTAPWNFTYTIDGINPTNVSTSANPYALTVADSGMYEITALSDANYTGTCFSGYAKVKVNDVLPSSNITSPNDTVCEGTIVNVEIDFTGLQPWTFTYSIDSILTDTVTTSDTSFILPVTSAGLYEVTSLYGRNGCSASSMTGNTHVTVNPLPTSTFAQGHNTIDICQGDTVDLDLAFTGVGPWTFTYTINDLNPVNITTVDSQFVIKAFQAGVYEVKQITDSNCVADWTDTYPEIIVHDRPTAQIATIDSNFCEGNYIQIPITLSGKPPFSFTYSYNNVSTITYSNIHFSPYNIGAYQTGLYALDSVSDKYCDATDLSGQSNITIDSLPNASFAYTVDTADVRFTNSSKFATSYLWDFDDGQTNTTSDPIHTYAASGSYTVTLTATNYCGNDVFTETIEVDVTLFTQSFENESFKIYPNPSDGRIYLELGHMENEQTSLDRETRTRSTNGFPPGRRP